jgi:hypothetical protein
MDEKKARSVFWTKDMDVFRTNLESDQRNAEAMPDASAAR